MCICFLFVAAVRKNPLAKNTTLNTLQVTVAKWLYGARDRNGGHKARVIAAAAARAEPSGNNDSD